MKKRITLQCWHCDEIYSLHREIHGRPKLIVECPFCEQEAVVDLAPFRDETVVVARSIEPVADDGSEIDVAVGQDLPDRLPTRAKGVGYEDEDESSGERRLSGCTPSTICRSQRAEDWQLASAL